MLKYALIGCGRISFNHLVAAQNNSLEIVAICDIDSQMMQDKIMKLNLNPTISQYTNYSEMLEKEKPNLVAIATESGKHAEIALKCIEFGCHLIIEKPIALSLQDAEEIILKAREKNVKVCVCHQNRFNKSIQKLKEAVDKRRFGRLYYGTAHIRWARDYEYYHRASWRGTWAQDGGSLMNQCIHNIDLLRWLMGDNISEVVGFTDRLKHNYIEAEDFGIALIRFENGCYGVIEGTTNVYPKNLEETLYLFGEKGTVKIGGESVNAIENWNFADLLDQPDNVIKEYSETPPNIYGFGHSKLYADVINAIIHNHEPFVNAEAGKRALELVLAIYQSASLGQPISFPLNPCKTLDFINRFSKPEKPV